MISEGKKVEDFYMKEEQKVLEVVKEEDILGKKIKMYGSLEFPWFLAKDVAEWIDYSKLANGSYQVSMMIKKVDDSEKAIKIFYTPGGNQEAWFLTEDGLYECCMRSTRPAAKDLKKEIKKYLYRIRLTGAAISEGREQDMVNYYFSGLSSDLQSKIVNELMTKNKELQALYDDLLNTEGLYHTNMVAKELKIGRNTMLSYLRGKKVLFYQDNANVPYQRFMNQGLFSVVESPCADGKYRPVTYVTKKGLDYIRKLLRKDEYYGNEIVPE